MNKQAVFFSVSEVELLRQRLIAQMEESCAVLHRTVSTETPVSALQKIKFEKIISDRVFGEPLNFIEHLNQTFTYLVCLYAARTVLERCAATSITVNFGTHPGYDVTSDGGSILCECFASTSVKSNEKLKKDVLRLHESTLASQKFVFFYSHAGTADTPYIQRLAANYPDVSLCSIPFEELIGSSSFHPTP